MLGPNRLKTNVPTFLFFFPSRGDSKPKPINKRWGRFLRVKNQNQTLHEFFPAPRFFQDPKTCMLKILFFKKKKTWDNKTKEQKILAPSESSSTKKHFHGQDKNYTQLKVVL
jgi:hypothetical protein